MQLTVAWRVVALSHATALGRLRSHLGAERLREVRSVEELAAALRDDGARWVVMDPMALSTRAYESALHTIESAGVRLVFHTPLDGFDHTRLLEAHQRLLPELVFRGTGENWIEVASVLRRDEESAVAVVLASLAPRIGALLDQLRRRTLALFGALPIPSDAKAFAASCQGTTGSVRAAYQRAGLAAPHDLLDIARLAYAYQDLADRTASLEDVAARRGFGTARTLERRVKALVGFPPRKAVRACGRDEFAKRLQSAAFRHLRDSDAQPPL